VLVAMALGYNVSIRGKKDKASGEIIFNSPDSPEEEETEEETEEGAREEEYDRRTRMAESGYGW